MGGGWAALEYQEVFTNNSSLILTSLSSLVLNAYLSSVASFPAPWCRHIMVLLAVFLWELAMASHLAWALTERFLSYFSLLLSEGQCNSESDPFDNPRNLLMLVFCTLQLVMNIWPPSLKHCTTHHVGFGSVKLLHQFPATFFNKYRSLCVSWSLHVHLHYSRTLSLNCLVVILLKTN